MSKFKLRYFCWYKNLQTVVASPQDSFVLNFLLEYAGHIPYFFLFYKR